MKKIILLAALVLATLTLVSCGKKANEVVNTKQEPTGAEIALDIYAKGAVYGEGGNAYARVASDPVELVYLDENGILDDLVARYNTFLEQKRESWKELKEKGASFTYEIKSTHNIGGDDLALVKNYFVTEEEYGYASGDIEEAVIFEVEAALVVNGIVAPYSLNLLHPGEISEMPFVKIKGTWCYKPFLTADFIEELK